MMQSIQQPQTPAQNVDQCPICSGTFRIDEIRHNIQKCDNCLVMFHSNCINRLKKGKDQKLPKCPTCRCQYHGQPLTKLQRLYVRSNLELLKCELCGEDKGRDHLKWCFIEKCYSSWQKRRPKQTNQEEKQIQKTPTNIQIPQQNNYVPKHASATEQEYLQKCTT